jgi:hypothetical protein
MLKWFQLFKKFQVFQLFQDSIQLLNGPANSMIGTPGTAGTIGTGFMGGREFYRAGIDNEES